MNGRVSKARRPRRIRSITKQVEQILPDTDTDPAAEHERVSDSPVESTPVSTGQQADQSRGKRHRDQAVESPLKRARLTEAQQQVRLNRPDSR